LALEVADAAAEQDDVADRQRRGGRLGLAVAGRGGGGRPGLGGRRGGPPEGERGQGDGPRPARGGGGAAPGRSPDDAGGGVDRGAAGGCAFPGPGARGTPRPP